VSDPLDASVLIATYNRAEWLDRTLASLAAMAVSPARRWEVIVIDNNSVDDTRAVVERHQHTFPVPLVYLFESRQGRSSALNAGIAAARGTIAAFTDDDVRVSAGWLEAALNALQTKETAYAGGPVRPMWEVPPPRWLDLTRSDLWGTIAIQDHGDRVISYETARKVPLGANMAVRREVFDIVGRFRSDLGRSSGRTLLGQEVPEWLMRVRGAGLGGLYVPAMEVHHHVPAGRLTKQYFRKWWFGKGASRAAVDAVQPVTELGIDLRRTPHVLGLPRFMYGTLLRDVVALAREWVRGRPAAAFRHEMMIAFFVGYASSRRRLVRVK
jgi:glucosyl-dolichyl phosphate glucuronosyltransferase